MAAPVTYKRRRVTIDTVTWTAITASIDCNRIVAQNGGESNVKFRTDPADANTESLPVSPDAYENLICADARGPLAEDRFFRFLAGTTYLYAQAVSGTGPIIVTEVR